MIFRKGEVQARISGLKGWRVKDDHEINGRNHNKQRSYVVDYQTSFWSCTDFPKKIELQQYKIFLGCVYV